MPSSKYEDNTLQNKEKVHKELLRFCAPSYRLFCCRYLGIRSNPAILSYRKIRMVLSRHLVQVADKLLEGLPGWTKAVSADGVKAAVVAAWRKKWLPSVF